MKIGDKVIVNRQTSKRISQYGTIVGINKRSDNSIYFYSVMDDLDEGSHTIGWSYNVFPPTDKIEIDFIRNRENKLSELGI